MTGSTFTHTSSIANHDRGWCLCLSGGGFRATLFHLGAITRLNELGVLSRLSTITSVSGGSILNGILACRWSQLEREPSGKFSNLEELVAKPTREFCATDLRTPLLLGTRLKPSNWRAIARDRFSVSANTLAKHYEPLFGLSLGDLPLAGPESPRFVFCATNVTTGACWHFHSGPNGRMGDFYCGYSDASAVRVSDAVAASSAFPPGFSALRLRVGEDTEWTRDDPWGDTRVVSTKRPEVVVCGSDVLLTDGGVYDNLGVEPVWRSYKKLLVSDAGRPFECAADSSQGIIPRLKRAGEISMEQVGAVRKRWLVESFTEGHKQGAIWTINSRLEEFPLADAVGLGEPTCKLIQRIRTDLDAFTDSEIYCLENHGYSMADAGLRSRVTELSSFSADSFHWPHPEVLTQHKLQDALANSHKRWLLRDAVRYFGSLLRVQ